MYTTNYNKYIIYLVDYKYTVYDYDYDYDYDYYD
jgi:hypothetical protein